MVNELTVHHKSTLKWANSQEVEAFEKLEKRIRRIGTYSAGGFDTLGFPGLFSTKIGQKLGRQLGDLSAFVFSSTLLTFPVGKLQSAWLTLVRTGDIEKLKPISDSEEDYEKLVEMMTILAELLDDDELDLSHFFGRRELRRFLALLSLSAFAYLDSYGRLLIDHIKENTLLEKKVLEYLKMNEVRSNKDESNVETLVHVKNLGVSQRFDVLEESLDVQEMCRKVFGETEYTQNKKLFKYFIKLRGEMTHGNPEPSLRKFDHKFFKRARIDVKEAISILPDLHGEIPEPL